MAKKPMKAAGKAAPKASAKPSRPHRPARTSQSASSASRSPARTADGARSDQKRGASKPSPDVVGSDPTLFTPLTPGECADAVRTLTEDRRVHGMAKVGRYRVIATEPLVVKPPHWMAGHRLARVVVYDYAADRCVDACVDLDAGVVAHLDINKAQPMLSREEESVAISVAVNDERVRETLVLGDEPMIVMHYWGKDTGDLAFERRSAAVVFGRAGGHATLVAVVDLLDNAVTSVVPAAKW